MTSAGGGLTAGAAINADLAAEDAKRAAARPPDTGNHGKSLRPDAHCRWRSHW